MRSFAFADEDYLAVSVEIRKERGEAFNSLAGFFRQYELMYVVADEIQADIVLIQGQQQAVQRAIDAADARQDGTDFTRRLSTAEHRARFEAAVRHSLVPRVQASISQVLEIGNPLILTTTPADSL